MDFGQLKDKFKENEDFTSVLSQIESEYTALSGKKESAVENEIKLRNTKQEIAKAFGLEENIPASELVNKISEILTGYKTKIDSFEKNASSKELENASVKEQLQTLTNQLNEYSAQLEKERATNKLNDLKGKAREALSQYRITDPKAQDMVINANLSTIDTVEDFGQFAKSIAESNPFLTETIHKAGAGSAPYSGDRLNNKNLGSVDLNDSKARTAIISERLASKGY